MIDKRFIVLQHRGVLSVAGEDRVSFLQGLVSNDVTKAGPNRAIYSALLTPQGKFLHEFFIVALQDRLLLDAEAARIDDLRKRLLLYKLRSKVSVEVAAGMAVAAVLGEGVAADFHLPNEAGAAAPFESGVAFVDPRLAAAGLRVLMDGDELPDAISRRFCAAGTLPEYDRHRLALGLPDGSRDLPVEKAILLENGFDELHGIDWQKGCYMGQELTARTRYRGLVRKRLMPVRIDGPLPAPGTPIMLGEAEAGEMRSGIDGLGLAMIRLEQFEKAATADAAFTAGDSRLRPVKPDWAVFPAAE